MSAGVTPNSTLNMAPVSGEDGQALCYNASSDQYSPGTPLGAGTYISTPYSMVFTAATGTGTFVAGDWRYTVTPLNASGGNATLVHGSFSGATTSVVLGTTPAAIQAPLPAGFPGTAGSTAGCCIVTDGGTDKLAQIFIDSGMIQIALPGANFSNGAAAIDAFEVTYLSFPP